jgi:sulfatase modifying factor 1
VVLVSLALPASILAAAFATFRHEPRLRWHTRGPGHAASADAPPPVASGVDPVPAEPAPVRPLEPRRVRVPAATFVMGSAAGEADERVRRKVMIDAFEIDATETTVLAFRLCEERGACRSILEVSKATSEQCNRPHGDRLDHPINCVTWDEAAAFCDWIGERLPTEAEWEYAAAGGEQGRANAYPWGATPGALRANGAGDADGFAFTAPVGSFPRGATGLGVLDMAGNVEEWVADPYSTVLMEGVSMPDSRRVVRGGSYASDPRELRTSRRGKAPPGLRTPTLGFRCARAPG